MGHFLCSHSYSFRNTDFPFSFDMSTIPSLPPGFSISFIRASTLGISGVSKTSRVKLMKTASKAPSLKGRHVASAQHSSALLASPFFSSRFFVLSIMFGEISMPQAFPAGPTSSAIHFRQCPVPTPISSTISPSTSDRRCNAISEYFRPNSPSV